MPETTPGPWQPSEEDASGDPESEEASSKKNQSQQHHVIQQFVPNVNVKVEDFLLQESVVCPNLQADIVLLLDSSGSIRDANPPDQQTDHWKNMLQFLANIVNGLPIGENQVRIGAVRFSDRASVRFKLDDYYSKKLILEKILNMGYVGGYTNTAEGLRVMRSEAFDPRNGGARGDRVGVPNIAILVTDGASTKQEHLTIPYANDAKDDGIQILVVGITDKVKEAELAAISSTGKRNETYWMSTDVTVDLLRRVIQTTCYFPTPTPSLPDWEEWSPCTASCDGGTQTRRNMCIREGCTGPRSQSRMCNSHPCSKTQECVGQADITFVVDSSSSIRGANPDDLSYDNWQLMLEFMVNLVNRMAIGRNDIRVACVSYSNKATVEFYLDQHYDKASLTNAIENIPYIGNTTNTADALLLMRTTTFSRRGNRRGDRPKVPNVAILISDGSSNVQHTNTIPYADDAKRDGIRIFTVGVTDAAYEKELKAISSTGVLGETYWKSADFTILDSLLDRVVNQTCREVTGWSSWLPWSQCMADPQSVSCEGRQSRNRSCDATRCNGQGQQIRTCTVASCPGPLTYECKGQADITFVVDSSSSIRGANPDDLSYDNWQLMLEFMVNLVNRMAIGRNDIRVACVSYSNEAVVQFYLDEHYDKVSLTNAIENIPYMGNMTNTADGLLLMRTSTFSRRGNSRGDRPKVPNIAIVISDGSSNVQHMNTIPYANNAKWDGIRIFVVGVTDAAYEQELKAISSTGVLGETYWKSVSFARLDRILTKIVNQTCRQVTGWAAWGRWTPCSASCDGTQQRTRTCNSMKCDGSGQEFRSCNINKCGTQECRGQVDLTFVMDSSRSIRGSNPRDNSYDNWDLMLKFMINVVNRLAIGPSGIRVGCVRYSNEAVVEFRLDRYHTKSALTDAIRRIPHMDNLTNTAEGLQLMRTRVFDPTKSGFGGDRKSVPNVAILITDGASNVNQELTTVSAAAAKQDGVYLLVVGITDRAYERELRDISSTGVLGNTYWMTADFTVMDSIINSIINQTCTRTIQDPPGWSTWGSWSKCTVSCGEGSQIRIRTCGSTCRGSSKQTRRCNSQICSRFTRPDFGWGTWLPWSGCSVTCGFGFSTRVRVCRGDACPDNPYDVHGVRCVRDDCPT